ncbi:hypothetical protein [Rhodoferax aquaticus]|uniref:Uncharacterized protein n=1 Tax=Rhodoferax aquaticus TaxID=2527691 RepID=A0A515ESA8_9BURK|nr:hypothetical protein [Rhodoferax aquaticus]QDL55545.1 hypothetical protein EXZ61_15930 [Rhodoferax aquaticus]
MRIQKDLFHHDGASAAPIVKRNTPSLAQSKRPLVAVASADTFVAAQTSAANDSVTLSQNPFTELPNLLLARVG